MTPKYFQHIAVGLVALEFVPSAIEAQDKLFWAQAGFVVPHLVLLVCVSYSLSHEYNTR